MEKRIKYLKSISLLIPFIFVVVNAPRNLQIAFIFSFIFGYYFKIIKNWIYKPYIEVGKSYNVAIPLTEYKVLAIKHNQVLCEVTTIKEYKRENYQLTIDFNKFKTMVKNHN